MVFGINGYSYIDSDKNGINPNIPGYHNVETVISCFGNGYASNPIKKSHEPSEKEKLYEKLANVKNPELRTELENILNGGNPSQAFIDMLIARYEKKQEEFDLKWAQYEEAKGNMKSLKAVLEKLQTKYADSESNYENGLVRMAEKNYNNAELDADILLSVASYLAHRVI